MLLLQYVIHILVSIDQGSAKIYWQTPVKHFIFMLLCSYFILILFSAQSIIKRYRSLFLQKNITVGRFCFSHNICKSYRIVMYSVLCIVTCTNPRVIKRLTLYCLIGKWIFLYSFLKNILDPKSCTSWGISTRSSAIWAFYSKVSIIIDIFLDVGNK